MHYSHQLFLLRGGRKGNVSPLFCSSVTESHQVTTIASPKAQCELVEMFFTTVSVSEASTDWKKVKKASWKKVTGRDMIHCTIHGPGLLFCTLAPNLVYN